MIPAICAISGVMVGAVLMLWAALALATPFRDHLLDRIHGLETALAEERDRSPEITVELPKQMDLTPAAVKALGAAIADSFKPGKN